MTTTAATNVTPADFDYVSHLVTQRSAIVLTPEKTYLVESRLTPLARDLGFESISGLVQGMRTGLNRSAIENQVVEALTTNETSWFRDMHPFDAMRQVILPDLLVRNASLKSLRIWSAACSTGQELYSITMLLDSEFPQLAEWNQHLIGTDLSPKVVQRAKSGRFSGLEVNRGLPAQLLVKYFERDGRDYEISAALRRKVSFEEQNLVTPWPRRAPFDVVFLRNVLIYFDIEKKREVLRNMWSALAPGGYLVLGAAETIQGLTDYFTSVPVGGSVVFQRKER